MVLFFKDVYAFILAAGFDNVASIAIAISIVVAGNQAIPYLEEAVMRARLGNTKLACSLRWMAGGSYLDICFEFGVAIGSFYADGGVLWGTLC